MTGKASSAITLLLTMLGCVRPGQHPHAGLFPPIAQEYYACSTCRSLHGGIYGKGPTMWVKAENADQCRHSWTMITLAEFQERAASEFPDQWAKAGAYFKRPVKQ